MLKLNNAVGEVIRQHFEQHSPLGHEIVVPLPAFENMERIFNKANPDWVSGYPAPSPAKQKKPEKVSDGYFYKGGYTCPVLITDNIEDIGTITILSAPADMPLEEAKRTGRIKVESSTSRVAKLLANEDRLLIRVRALGYKPFEMTANVESGSQVYSIMIEDTLILTEEEMAERDIEEGDDF